MKTKDVKRAFADNYLIRAEECLRAAEGSLQKNDWNAAAICAVHGCISAGDALCVHFLEKRHAGDNHKEAMTLLKSINPESDVYLNQANRFSRVLGIKHMAEYEKRLVFRIEAERALKDCERFVAFVKEELGK